MSPVSGKLYSADEPLYDSSTKNMILIITGLSSFLTPFMGSSINIALPAIAQELSLNAMLLSWVAAAYLLAAAVFLVPLGKIADIHGRKKIFMCGIVLYTVASFVSAFAKTAPVLIVARILQGMGGAMIFGTGVAILTSVFPAAERGKALGINTATVYCGLSLGPFLGGFLTQYFGWRSIFLINAILGLLIVSFVIAKMKGEWAEAKGEGFDIIGAIIYSFLLVAVMYGFSLLPALSGGLFILCGIVILILFIVWEMRAQHPLLNMNLFRANKVFGPSNLAALINYSATSAVGFLLSLYLQYIKGLNPQSAGLVLVSQPIMMAIFSPVAGRISDRIEPRIVASYGMAVTVVGLFLLIFLNKNTPLWFIVITLILLGFGFGLFSSPNTNAVMSSVERRFYGVASSTLGTMRCIGQMLSLGIVMLIFAFFIGKVQITSAYYGLFLASSRIAFVVFTVLCFGGIFASLSRGKVR